MAEIENKAAEQENTNVRFQDEALAVLRDAEGIAWDEFDRMCRGIGASALASEYAPSDFRLLQINARWQQ